MQELTAFVCILVFFLPIAWFLLYIIVYMFVGVCVPRHLAVVTNKRALLLTFSETRKLRRIKHADQPMNLPPRTFVPYIEFLPRELILTGVNSFDYRKALSNETVGFEMAVRFLVFFNTQ